MGFRVDEALVSDVARVVVAQVAPAELPAFGVVSEAYFSTPHRVLAQRGDSGLVDVGLGEAVTVLTLVVLAVMIDVTKHLLGQFVTKAVTCGGTHPGELAISDCTGLYLDTPCHLVSPGNGYIGLGLNHITMMGAILAAAAALVGAAIGSWCRRESAFVPATRLGLTLMESLRLVRSTQY